MHYVEAGEGPLIVLLHGFPECWFSWRHQLPALAGAGYRVAAPDLRGYGRTDSPEAPEAYDIFHLAGDVVGLVNALHERSAVIVGHDWGAWIAANLSLLRPDLFLRTVLLSVPYVPRRLVNQTQWEQQTYPGKVFYQAMLRAPGADQYLQADVRASLLRSYYSLSAQAPDAARFRPVLVPGPRSGPAPAIRPAWISEEDVDYLESEFRRSGFTGGLNYYRNMDRNWAMTAFLDGAKILQPTLFLAGEQDPVIEFHHRGFEEMEVNVPNLRSKILLPGVGHWTPQEAPGDVNRLLIDFLSQRLVL